VVAAAVVIISITLAMVVLAIRRRGA